MGKRASGFHNSRTGQFSYCRECRRDYDRDYYARRGRDARLRRQRARASEAQAWVNTLKAGIPCVDCNGIFPTYVMQWDHLPGYKKRGAISRMRTMSRALVMDEILKCELVCANCHAVRTALRARGIDTARSERSERRIGEPMAAYSFAA